MHIKPAMGFLEKPNGKLHGIELALKIVIVATKSGIS
jgi:hypothetical protein